MTQRTRVLTMLQTAGDRGVTSNEFYAAHLPRFGGRLFELRERGYVIETARITDSLWRYTLTHEPAVVSAPPPSAPGPEPSEGAPPAMHGGGADTNAALFEMEPHKPTFDDLIPDVYGDEAA